MGFWVEIRWLGRSFFTSFMRVYVFYSFGSLRGVVIVFFLCVVILFRRKEFVSVSSEMVGSGLDGMVVLMFGFFFMFYKVLFSFFRFV